MSLTFSRQQEMSGVTVDRWSKEHGASFQTWYAQGEAQAERGNYAQALRYFEEALILDPANPAALLYQVVCLIHLEQPKPALAIAEKLLKADPSQAQGWLFRGVALHRLGRYKEAYASYDRAEALTTGVR
jgi:tetratricopeptide (TPR) repeat protein